MPSTAELRQDLYALTVDLMAASNSETDEGRAIALWFDDLLFLISQAKDLSGAVRVLKAAGRLFRVSPQAFDSQADEAWREDLLSRIDFL